MAEAHPYKRIVLAHALRLTVRRALHGNLHLPRRRLLGRRRYIGMAGRPQEVR